MYNTSAAFFNDVVNQYDSLIQRHIPRYAELFWAMFYYLPATCQPKRILELGCGTGNLTALLHQQFPKAHITAVDLAPNMLAAAAGKLPADQKEMICASFTDLDFPPQQFDLIISSLALHHLSHTEHEQIIRNAYQWLTSGGFLVLGDGIRTTSERLFQADCDHWDQLSLEHGISPDELAPLIEHRQAHDHYGTIRQYYDWLENAQFTHVDMVWRYCIWGVFHAQKPTA